MNNFKPRNLLLVLALVLAVILVALIVINRRPESRIQQVAEVLPKGVDVALMDIDYTHIEGGLARWRMVARQVERHADSGVILIKSPQLSFYDDQGEVVGSMQAAEGSVSEDYQQVHLTTDVVLKENKGYSISTDELDYDHAQQVAVTDKRVHIETPGVLLAGTGMNFNLRSHVLKLHADVKGSFLPR